MFSFIDAQQFAQEYKSKINKMIIEEIFDRLER